MADTLYAIRSTYTSPEGSQCVSYMAADGVWEPWYLFKNNLAVRPYDAAMATVEMYKKNRLFNPDRENVELVAFKVKSKRK